MDDTKQIIAVFDFDKTIIAKHTFIRFLRYISGVYKYYYILLSLIPAMVKYKMGFISLMALREKAIKKYFHGLTKESYEQRCKLFIKEYVNKWLLEDAIKRIRWHKSMNHKLVLLSNSPEDYLKVWGEQFDFDYIMGTQFEFYNGKATGKIIGNHCFGKGKVDRLKEALGNLDDYYIYGYGDSDGDLDFLNLSHEAHYKFFNLKKVTEI